MLIPFDLAKAVNHPSKPKKTGTEDLDLFFELVSSLQNKLNAEPALRSQRKLVLISSADTRHAGDDTLEPDSDSPVYVTSPYGEMNVCRHGCAQTDDYIEKVMADLQSGDGEQVENCLTEHQKFTQQYVKLIPEQSTLPAPWTLCISPSSISIKTKKRTR